VNSVLGTYLTVSEQPNAGKLRALPTASRTRIEPLPEVPSVAESSYDHYGVEFWLGLFTPAKTSKETIFHSPIGSVRQMQGPEVRAKLVAQGLYPVEAAWTLPRFFENNMTTSSMDRRTKSRNGRGQWRAGRRSAALASPSPWSGPQRAEA
jgi:Tripartite tricarboxylate transporter family receptor